MIFFSYRNARIWKGTYNDGFEPLETGKTNWYECRSGVFEFGDGHIETYINLTCINDPHATPWRSEPPYWDPPFDHLHNPFPKCVMLCKYWYQEGLNLSYNIIWNYRLWSLQGKHTKLRRKVFG